MFGRVAGRGFVLSVLAVSASAAMVGAIALAAATGSGAPRSDHAAAAASGHSQASTHSQKSAHAPKSADDTDEANESEDASGNPSPSLKGLCNAWLHKPHQHGKADESAAFKVLIAAAGGKSKVVGYCERLVDTKTHPKGNGSSHRHVPARPSGAGTHPTGKPTGAGAQSSHASGRP
jgi:hypothetical protein